jgi:hypothetical protein
MAMNEFDRSIRESLSAEDAELFDRLGADQSLHRQVLETLGGRHAWLNVAGWIAGFALFAAGAAAAWQFMQANDIAEMLRWGAASALAFAGLGLVKVWFWLELQTNAVVREVKRLEVQVASLAAQVRR